MQMMQYLRRHTENFEYAFFQKSENMFNTNTQDI